MTEEEKQQHRIRKRTAARMAKAALRDIPVDIEKELLNASSLYSYIKNVVCNPKAHNEYEILGVLSFLRKVRRYKFDSNVVVRFCRFYKCLPFEGTTGMTNYELTPVQVFIVANLFGLKTTNSQGEEIRLIRDAYIFCPRKFAKTTFSAAIAVWFLLFESFNSQAYFIANSFDQAKVAFNMMRSIMQSIDPDGETFRVNRETIFFENRSDKNFRASFARCLSSNPKNLDGLFAELVIRDEGAQARDTATKSGADLKNVLTSSEGPRLQPLNIDITTASDVVDGPFAHELQGVYSILESSTHPTRNGITTNDTLFAILFQPDVDDTDLSSKKLWAKIQPHLGITVQPDYYEKEWLRAQISPENMLTFKTKLLNIFCINEEEVWISPETQRLAELKRHDGTPMSEEEFWQMVERYANTYGTPSAYAAVDLSTRGDFTSATIDIYMQELQQHWLISRFYLPDGVRVWDDIDADGRAVRREEQPFDGKIHSQHPGRFLYQAWADNGYLHLTHGELVDWEPLVEWLMDCTNNRPISMQAFGYDDWKATEFVNMICAAQGHSGGLQPVGQTPSEFTTPCMVYKKAICTGHLFHLANPIMTFCHQNAMLREDSMHNIKPEKMGEDPAKKIDGLITSLMALKMHIETGHKVRNNDIL